MIPKDPTRRDMARYRFGGGAPPPPPPPAAAAPAPPPPPPPPPPPEPAPTKENPEAKASADAAKAAQKTLAKRRGGRQSLVLEAPSQNPIGGSGRSSTSLLGGGNYPV